MLTLTPVKESTNSQQSSVCTTSTKPHQRVPLEEVSDLGYLEINSITGRFIEAGGKRFAIIKSNTKAGGTVLLGEDTLMKLLDRMTA